MPSSISSSQQQQKKRLLIVAPLDLQISGNNTTIKRLGKLLQQGSPSEYDDIQIRSCCSQKHQKNQNLSSASAQQRTFPETFEFDCVIGLHALRCAKWLLATEGKYLIHHQLEKSSSSSSLLLSSILNSDEQKISNNFCNDSDTCSIRQEEIISLKRLVENAPCPPSSSSLSSDYGAHLRPFILIFGGTDINEFSQDPSKVALMKVAVDRAVKCVCFSEAMKNQAIETFYNNTSTRTKRQHEDEEKFVVIPQTVDDEIWTICNKLLRFDHFETRPDAKSPREIDQILYEAQKMQFDREEVLRQQQKIAPSNDQQQRGGIKNYDHHQTSQMINNKSRIIPPKVEDPSFSYGWRHDEWLTGDSVKRWIVMPAGIRKVKNQLAVLQMVVELNRIAMKREVDSILEDSGKKNGETKKSDIEEVSDYLKKIADDENDVDSAAVPKEKLFAKDHLPHRNSFQNKSKENNSNNSPLAEWGLLLLGPEIESEYSELIEIATSWFLDKHQANTIVVWHRTGISSQRLCTLLFDKCNNVSLVVNASFSEGQPQAIMEAMVATAVQRQKEEMEMFDLQSQEEDENEKQEVENGFLCAVSNCSGNLAVLDDSCGIVLPFRSNDDENSKHHDNEDADIISDPKGWAEKIDREFFNGDKTSSLKRRNEKRDNAAKRAKERMQSIPEMLEWKKLLDGVLNENDKNE